MVIILRSVIKAEGHYITITKVLQNIVDENVDALLIVNFVNISSYSSI